MIPYYRISQSEWVTILLNELNSKDKIVNPPYRTYSTDDRSQVTLKSLLASKIKGKSPNSQYFCLKWVYLERPKPSLANSFADFPMLPSVPKTLYITETTVKAVMWRRFLTQRNDTFWNPISLCPESRSTSLGVAKEGSKMRGILL